MIQDKTIDEALIEIMRTKKALEALRSVRKSSAIEFANGGNNWLSEGPYTAAAKRASLDLTRKLADLRAGR